MPECLTNVGELLSQFDEEVVAPAGVISAFCHTLRLSLNAFGVIEPAGTGKREERLEIESPDWVKRLQKVPCQPRFAPSQPQLAQ
jgi:hypothetical protein